VIYPFNTAKQTPIDTTKASFAAAAPGNGPRHLEMHPAGKYAYLMEELSGTVAVYQYNNGQLKFIQRISSHPQEYKGSIGSADIHVSPDGKFLYASNRGDANSLAIFSIGADGRLTSKGFQPVMGSAPRNFMIDPTGSYLLVANQNSNNIVVFKRNKKTGLLTEAAQIDVPNPVCLKMVK
jgi:6-phosphogluconolactonase